MLCLLIIQICLIEYPHTHPNKATFFTELLPANTQQANTNFIDIVFFCNGYEDHLTNGGCFNRTVPTCPSRQRAQLQCYNSKNYEQ